MSDYDALTYYRLTGRYNAIVGDTTGFFGDAGPLPDLYNVNMTATLDTVVLDANNRDVGGVPELRLTTTTPPRTLLLGGINAAVESGALRLPGADIDGVVLVAKSDVITLGSGQKLGCRVKFGTATIGGRDHQYDPVLFAVPVVPTADFLLGRVQIVTLTGAPSGGLWNLLYGNAPTANLGPAATNVQVQTALRALAAIPDTAVSVAGANGGPYTVTFDHTQIPRPLILGAIDNLTGASASDIGVEITDNYVMPVVDLTTVTRLVAA